MEYLDKEGGKYLATKLKSYVDNKVTDLPSGGTVDLTNYYTKEETDQLLANLPSGGTGTKGDKGDTGVGVSSIKLVNYELIITLTDGTVHNLGNVRGEKGIQGEKGTDGINGKDGAKGADGVSPTVSVTETTNGHTVAITDVNGTQSFEVLNGKDGISGGTGTGETEYEYDMNLDFSNKTFYFDTVKNLSEILTESDYYLHMRDASATGSMNGACFQYKNGILYFTALVDGAISSICLYSSKGEQPWKYDTYTFPSTFKTPIYGKYAEDSTDDSIRPKELYKAIMSCVKKIVDSDGNEVKFKTVKESSGGSSGGASVVYSTDETAIGTWIDGKTIYRKVYQIPKLDSVDGDFDRTDVNLNLEVDSIINIHPIWKYGNNSGTVIVGNYCTLGVFNDYNTSSMASTLNEQKKSEMNVTYDFGANSKKIKIWRGSSARGYACTLIVEYTKL